MSMKAPAPAMSSVPTPVNFSRPKPSPPENPARPPENAMSKLPPASAATNASPPATGEGNVEVHSGLGGGEGLLLREPCRAPVELERAHLARDDAGQPEPPV